MYGGMFGNMYGGHHPAGARPMPVAQPPPPPKPDPVQTYCSYPLPGTVEGVGKVVVTTDDYQTLKER